MSGKPVKIAVIVPCGDQVATFWAYDLARLTAYTVLMLGENSLGLIFCTGSLIMKQRETLVKTVCEDGSFTHMLFLDSDMRFPKDTAIRLLERNVPAVCASYTERNPPFRPVAFADAEDFGNRVWPTPESTGLKQIAACGLGCALIEVAAIQKVKNPRFMVGYNPSTEVYMGEDVYFCLKLKSDAGVDLMLDQDLTKEIAHIGRFEFGPEHALRAEAARNEHEKAMADAAA